MLVVGKSKTFNVSLALNLKFDWKAALRVVDFHPRMIPFLWLANTGVKPPIFKINRLKLQK